MSFSFQGVVRIIGNKNSKPRSSEIKRKQTTDTNWILKSITDDLWTCFEHVSWSDNNEFLASKWRFSKGRFLCRIKEYPAMKRDTQVNTVRQCRSGILKCIPFLRALFRFCSKLQQKSKNSQWFRDKLSIPILHLPLLSLSWGKQSVRRSAKHLYLWETRTPFSLRKYCSWLNKSFAVLYGCQRAKQYKPKG